jgi:hypothetical protein
MIMAGERCQIGKTKSIFDKLSSKDVSKYSWLDHRVHLHEIDSNILHVDNDDRISLIHRILYIYSMLLFVLWACSFEFISYLFYYSSKNCYEMMRSTILSMIFKFLLRFFWAKQEKIWHHLNVNQWEWCWWVEGMIKISHTNNYFFLSFDVVQEMNFCSCHFLTISKLNRDWWWPVKRPFMAHSTVEVQF